MDEHSVLEHIKTFVGISTEDDSFDLEILMHINSGLSKLNTVGLSSNRADKTSTWDTIFTVDELDDEAFGIVASFLTVHTKLLFDPPAPATMNYMQEYLNESICRLNISYDDHVGGGRTRWNMNTHY